MEERDITMKEAKTGQQGGQSSNIAQDIANGSDHDTTTVTTDSPTPSTSAFEPYQQQLQEAMLAAVNSQGLGSLSHNNLIAAVAAAAAAASAQQHQQQQQQQQHLQQSQHQAAKRPQQNIDRAKLDSIRASNRERKKRWRLLNEERNKDNDLRCRVNKRATKLFGPEDTAEKREWAQVEFEKRRQKRMEKERRKNEMLPGNQQNTSSELAGQQQRTDQPQPIIDQATAAKVLDFPPEIQRQLLEQLNAMIAMTTNGVRSAMESVNEAPVSEIEKPNAETSGEDYVQVKGEEEPQEQQRTEEQQEQVNENAPEQQGLVADVASDTTSASNSGQNSPSELKSGEESSDKQADGPSENGEKLSMDAVLTLMELNHGWRK